MRGTALLVDLCVEQPSWWTCVWSSPIDESTSVADLLPVGGPVCGAALLGKHMCGAAVLLVDLYMEQPYKRTYMCTVADLLVNLCVEQPNLWA